MKLRVIKVEPLAGNDIAPPLKLGDDYPLVNKIQDSKGNWHYDVGIKSWLNFVRSWETKELLPDGDKIWWIHPSRFEEIND